MPSIPTRKLHQKAIQARKKSYSPYSRYKVGAVIVTDEGRIFSGCNVENSSYGAAHCAERTAIHKAASELGGEFLRIREVLVVTDSNPPANPCGICLQVISEFCENATIHIADLKGVIRKTDLDTLMPSRFTPEDLGIKRAGMKKIGMSRKTRRKSH